MQSLFELSTTNTYTLKSHLYELIFNTWIFFSAHGEICAASKQNLSYTVLGNTDTTPKDMLKIFLL